MATRDGGVTEEGDVQAGSGFRPPGEVPPDLGVLDCTLRDGGYYTDWDFDDDLVTEYLDAVEAAGVDVVEIGYRSPPSPDFFGKYKVCREDHLRELFAGRELDCAVMVDAKKFAEPDGTLREELLEDLFTEATESVVRLVRAATTEGRLPETVALLRWLQERGYETSVNLMRASTLSPEELDGAVRRVADSPADYLYLADSYGAISPAEMREKAARVRALFPRNFGIHCHENLGLALANTLTAVEEGVDIADCTVTGIGRGAGNLPTELLLLYLRYKAGIERFDPGALVDVVAFRFEPLQERHRWGSRLAYMLSAAYNVHPSYPHELLATRRYGSDEVVHTLDALKRRGVGADFSQEQLDLALKERMTGRGDARRRVPELPSVRRGLPEMDAPRELLLVGSGPSVRERTEDLNRLIEARDPLVLECNLHPPVRRAGRHLCCFTNHKRLDRDLDRLPESPRPLLTGLEWVREKDAHRLEGVEAFYYPYEVHPDSFDHTAEGCVLPYDVVAMYAFAVGLELGAERFLLCGFDGYLSADHDDPPSPAEIVMQREMEEFFRLLQGRITGTEVEVFSLTPTSYDLPVRSLYAFF